MLKLNKENYNNQFFILLGLYLGFFFYTFFSTAEIISATSTYVLLKPWMVKLLGGLGVAFSAVFCFAESERRKKLSLVLYFLIVAAVNMNLALNQLHYTFISLCLIYVAFFWSERNADNYFVFRGKVFHSKLILAALLFLAVFISGASKFFFVHWRNGNLVEHFLLQNLGPSWPSLTFWPRWMFQAAALAIGLLELSLLPLFLYRRTRFTAWCAGFVLYAVIFAAMKQVTNIAIAMMIIHLFMYESAVYKTAEQSESP